MKNLRGYTLIEVLIALVIMSIVVTGAASLTNKVSTDLQWNRFFDVIEQQFFRVNMFALSRTSLAFRQSGEVDDMPDAYHLVFQKRSMWYVESRSENVVYSEEVEFSSESILLDDIQLVDEQGKLQELGGNGLVITWSGPFAQLSLHASAGFGGERLHLGEALCCSVSLSFLKEGTSDRRSITFDVQKSVSRSFY